MPARADVPLTLTDESEVEALRARVAELEASFDEAVQAAKLQALYNFAYGISHMINNPLSNIATRAQTLARDEADPERRKKLTTINQQAFRAHEMIADLMHFARPPRLKLQQVDLVQLAAAVVADMQPLAGQQGTKLSIIDDSASLVIEADPEQLSAAVKAIVQNALEAVKSGGQIELSALAEQRAQGSGFRGQHGRPSTEYSVLRTQYEETAKHIIHEPYAAANAVPTPHSELRDPHFVLSITDTGPGIPAESLPHVFDPYYSGREAGRGLGLGLSKAWRIVEQHGGRIEVENPPAGGARFTIVLPG
jgi:signal transduction histidine kinase